MSRTFILATLVALVAAAALLTQISQCQPAAPSAVPVDQEDRGSGSEAPRLESGRIDTPEAVGKRVRLRLWRGSTTPTDFTAYPCSDDVGVTWMTLAYEPSLRDRVLAIPPSILSDCATVELLITGRGTSQSHLVGEVIEIEKAPELAPRDVPEGATFASMDAINMAGDEAAGKVAVLPVYRGEIEHLRFTAHPCGRHGGIQLLYVHFEPHQREISEDLPASSLEQCVEIRLRLEHRDRFSKLWHAELIGLERMAPLFTLEE
jgi:hypothetical protein